MKTTIHETASQGGGYPLETTMEIEHGGATHRFIRPCLDQTGEVDWVRPLHTGLAYGQLKNGEWALLDCPSLSNAPKAILSRHSDFAKMRWAFFVEIEERRA